MNVVVAQTLASILNTDPQTITLETSQSNTPGWDSLAHLRIILELEQNLGIRFRAQDIPEMTSVARIHQVLQQNGVKAIQKSGMS